MSDENRINEEVTEPEHLDSSKYSEEELAKISAKARKLIKDDIVVQAACGILRESRRLYTIALQALARRCDEKKIMSEVESVLVGSMKQAGMEEFTREDLQSSFQRFVLPWLVAEVQEQHTREKALEAEDLQKEDEARRRQKILLPFRPSKRWEPENGECWLPRDCTMTLAGHPGAVWYVLSKIAGLALLQKDSLAKPRPSVLRLINENKQHNVANRVEDRQQLYTVGVNRWLYCGRSQKVVCDTLQPFLGFLDHGRVDLLVVDRLDLLHNPSGSVKTPAWVDAGRIQRNVRKWANDVGCAVVAGVPMPTDVPVTRVWDGVELDLEWTQLETYTDLVQLFVLEDSETTYRIHARQHLDPNTEFMLFKGISRALIDNFH